MNELAVKNNDVSLFVIQEDSNEITGVHPAIKIIRLYKKRVLHSFFPLLFKLRSTRADYIVSTLGYVNLLILFLSYLFPKTTKIIVREANMLSALIDASKYPRLTRLIYNTLYQRAYKIFVTSSLMKHEFEQRLNCKEGQLSIFYNPVNERLIHQSSQLACSYKKSTKKLIVLSGRFVNQKGFDRFAELVPDINDDVSILFLGDGPDREEIEQRINGLNQSHRTHFLGNVKNPWIYYKIADYFVMPSRWEGMPNSLLEALCCGTPCIATKESGGVQDIKNMLRDKNLLQICSFGPELVKLINDAPPKRMPYDKSNFLPQEFKMEYAYHHFLLTLSLVESDGK